MKTLLIAADHAGFQLKQALLEDSLLRDSVKLVDLGTHSTESTDYPSFAHLLCDELTSKKNEEDLLEPCGILICGSGVGMSIAANRHAGIRAVLTWDEEVAKVSRAHNASNVLCLGARFTNLVQARKVIQAWLGASFDGGRHLRRLQSI